jgi:hypothetical protein
VGLTIAINAYDERCRRQHKTGIGVGFCLERIFAAEVEGAAPIEHDGNLPKFTGR